MAFYLVVIFVGFVGVLGAIGIAYKMFRPHFAVRVSCWFCQESTRVPFGNRNCWDCPKCEQYNGFDKDGDYNKPIPAQRRRELNHTLTGRADTGPSNTPSILCDTCNRNQLLKVKQLASFVPFNEANFEAEVEAYKVNLEYAYRLCKSCSSLTQSEIQRQDDLLQSRLDPATRDKLQQTVQSALSESYLDWDDSNSYVSVVAILLHGFSLICAVSLLMTFLPSILESHQVMEDIFPLPCLHVLQSAKDLDTFLIFLGLFLNIFSKLLHGKLRIYLVDGLCSFMWLVLMFIHLSRLQDDNSQSHTSYWMMTVCWMTVVMTTVSLIWKRHPRSNGNISVRRMSLEFEKSDESGSNEASSVTQDCSTFLGVPASQFPECFRRPAASVLSQPLQREATVCDSPAWLEHDPWNRLQSNSECDMTIKHRPASLFSEPVKRDTTFASHKNNLDLNRSFTSAFSEPMPRQANIGLQHSPQSAFKVIRDKRPLGTQQAEETSFSTGHMYDDIDLELDSINLGDSPLKRRGSGLFSSNSSLHKFPTHGTTLSVPPLLRERRPLISPAKLSAVKFRCSTPSELTSVTTPSSQRTLFGDAQSVTSTQCQFANYRESTFGRMPSSIKPSSHANSLLIGQNHDNNSHSSQATHSSVCPVDSTTNKYSEGLPSKAVGNPWWQSGYVICGVLVLSVITNIVVVYTTVIRG